ncbi:MAG: hypothetical protein MUC43_02810 [Pirellula sp.]|jgi:hypothetical protein|nr:hypothetical protein [Pirellula sp.]
MAAISQSPSTAKVPRSQSPPSWNGIVIGIGVVLVSILVGGMALLWFFNGQAVAGEEFCPQTFQLRDFYYRRLPWVKTIVTPTRLNLKPLPVSTSVLQHIKRLPDERWDVAMVNEGVQQDIRAPRILIQALSPSTTSGSFWDSWSNKHPELAAVTWPIVQQAAVLQAYEIVPDILESALDTSYSNAPTPDAITNRWKSTLEDLSRDNHNPK